MRPCVLKFETAHHSLTSPRLLPFLTRDLWSRGRQTWLESHLTPNALRPVAISDIHNALKLTTRTDLEAFASRLADFAAGSADEHLTNAGLFHAVRSSLPPTYDQLDPVTRRDLHIFLMTKNPGMSLEGDEK